MSDAPQVKVPSSAELASFRREWAERSLATNWTPVWRFESAKRTVDVAFNAVTCPRRLARLSRVCERQWLARIGAKRSRFVAAAQRRGFSEAEARWQFERELCRRDLYYLAKYRLGYDKAVFHLHYFMAQSMVDLPAGYRGLREFPRDSYKSTFMTIAFMVQQVLIDPNVRILLKSNAEGNASNKLQEAKGHFVSNMVLRKLFPEHAASTKKEQGTNTEWTSPAKTSVQAEATFTAAGLGGSKVSQHYDIILGDDVWDDKSVTSPEVMAKTRASLEGLDYLLAAPAEGRVIFIGTRFAHDDPSSDLLRHPEFHCIVVSGITPSGRSLFPEQLPMQKFYYQSFSLYTFSCQIMLNPTDAERGFTRKWFRYAHPDEWQAAEAMGMMALRTVVLTDFTGGTSDRSDYAAALAVLINHRGECLVAEVVREKLNPMDFLEEVYRLADRWGADMLVRQNAPLENALESSIDAFDSKRRAGGEAGYSWVKYSLGKRSKEARMLGLQPMYQQGLILHHPEMDGLGELEQEIVDFPHNQTKDDAMDALSELTDATVSFAPRFTALAASEPDRRLTVAEIEAAADRAERRRVAALFARLENPVVEEYHGWML